MKKSTQCSLISALDSRDAEIS